MNWKKIDSITLFVTCHGLRNFPPLIHSPLISICEFSKPYKWDGVGHEGGGVDHTGVGLVIQGWGEVGHTGWGCVMSDGSSWGVVGHTGVGWSGSYSKTT